MTGFDHLYPTLQHHIVSTLGWPGLRPLQDASVEPLVTGKDALLLAPTAGGKTEAATFPVLTRMADEDWRGVSVLYICPLKALLNNLEERLRTYAGWIGRTVGIWHGDVTTSTRRRMQTTPPPRHAADHPRVTRVHDGLHRGGPPGLPRRRADRHHR